jgi:uncharacterized DUF497 family protein
MHEFEFEISKSLTNEVKHAISFDCAQEIWIDRRDDYPKSIGAW